MYPAYHMGVAEHPAKSRETKPQKKFTKSVWVCLAAVYQRGHCLTTSKSSGASELCKGAIIAYSLTACEQDTSTMAVGSVYILGSWREDWCQTQSNSKYYVLLEAIKSWHLQPTHAFTAFNALTDILWAPVDHRNTLKSHLVGLTRPLCIALQRKASLTLLLEKCFSVLMILMMMWQQRNGQVQYSRMSLDMRKMSKTPSAGASFRMASRIVQMMRDRTGLASIVRASEDKVTSFLDGMCSESSEVLRSNGINTWFSIAMEMSTHMSTSYLDIRIRLFTGGAVHNFHLLAIPTMFSHHTGEEIFLHAMKALLARV